MNTKFTHFIMVFFLLCFGLQGSLQADQKGKARHAKVDTSLPVVTRTLSAIVTEENSNVGNCVVLDDGSAWPVKGYLHGDESHIKLWTKGDRIALLWNSKIKGGFYIMYNLDHYGQPKVLLDPNSIDSFPYITQVFDNGKKVKLSDHSIWKITLWGRTSTAKWDVGQHVMIQGDGTKNNYSLTNLDIKGELFSDYKHAYASFEEFKG